MRIKIILSFAILLFILGCKTHIPKILIIGDSISIGYTPYVKELLDGRAIVVHNEGNAQHTGTGLEKIEEWVGTEKWDIVQFNWGLWDLAYRHEDSEIQGKRDKINGEVTYSPEQYKSNLESIVKKLKSLTEAKLLFVTTSYVPEGEAGRYVEDAIVYNEKAMQVMEDYNIPVNDIYGFSKQIHAGFATAADNVHFKPEGYSLLAEKIVEGLKSVDKKLR